MPTLITGMKLSSPFKGVPWTRNFRSSCSGDALDPYANTGIRDFILHVGLNARELWMNSLADMAVGVEETVSTTVPARSYSPPEAS